MKNKILIISSDQFGYLTDTFKYCEYARLRFEITYVGWDFNKPEIKLPGVKVINVSRNSNILVRNFRLLRSFYKEIKNGHDIVFATYTRGISIVKVLCPNTKFIIDVRTLGVNPVKYKRVIYNFFLKLEIMFFKDVSVISKGVAKQLKLKYYHHLPIGGECFSTQPKSFDTLSFLYVGTLANRKIFDCVKGFHAFLKNFPEYSSGATFTIIGDSPGSELNEICGYVKANKLEEYIVLTGLIPQNGLTPYFEKANIGISYIPLFSYYEHQPPTKTFEYLISGLPVLATSTFENKSVVFEHSGVLIEDNPDSVCKGIKTMADQRKYYNSDGIRLRYAQFKWENLVENIFIPLVTRLSI